MANDPVGANAAEQEAAVKRLLDGGQSFLRWTRRSRRSQFPASLKLKQYAARALLNLGATEEAKKTLEPLCIGLDPGGSAVPADVRAFSPAAAAHGARAGWSRAVGGSAVGVCGVDRDGRAVAGAIVG